ncbi:hypothetical protein LEP1GSC029_0181 [Leptospira interrogans str. 2002000626]|uniref:Uncharacterized protein n=1 Tax=Leptospira interrogans str. 2002000626 TaxID=996803 RepID=A0A829D7H9_LEPIR|nr:hypothetical protein LEP1GSC029_0181 [Leptospira interrogans str. 2002000626]
MNVYQQNESRIQKKKILMVLAVIPILMIGTFVYEVKQIQSEIHRVVWMRARVTQDYIRRISNQTRALKLSISHSMDYYEDSILDKRVLHKFKKYSSLKIFGNKNQIKQILLLLNF